MSQRMWVLRIVVGTMLLVGAGCGGGGGGSGGSSGQQSRASFRVVNDSAEAVEFVFLSLNSSSNWGPDQLGSSVIAPGQQFTITNITPGIYDYRLVSISGAEIVRIGIDLDAGVLWTVTVRAW